MRRPQTNGTVERFNGTISDMLHTHRLRSSEDLEQTLLRYVALYNHRLPQIGTKKQIAPPQTMKDWYATPSAAVGQAAFWSAGM